jgi:hypothetical protein
VQQQQQYEQVQGREHQKGWRKGRGGEGTKRKEKGKGKGKEKEKGKGKGKREREREENGTEGTEGSSAAVAV